MIRSRPALKALGLCVVVAGLMAGSGVAKAESGANWMVNGSNVTESLAPEPSVQEVESKTITVHMEISGTLVEFLCTGIKSLGFIKKILAALGFGKIDYTGCLTKLNGALSSVCKPKTAGQPSGTIETLELKGLLVLHEGKGIARIEPKTVGGNLAVIEFGEECSLPEKVPVKGVAYIKDSQGEEKVEKVTHLISQGPLTHLFAISDTAEHAVTILGSATVGLAGAHAGLKWSGLPG
jgi:hypothetical protein